MKKSIIWIFIIFLFGINILLPVLAQDTNDFEIIPKWNDTTITNAVNAVGKTWWSVRDNYNKQAQSSGIKNSVGNQIASGIMTRDTLLDYVVYLVRFLSQIGIVIGVVMIIYAGYLYASSIFDASNMSKGKAALTNAIIGVLVIAFSYAIMKLLTSAFLS